MNKAEGFIHEYRRGTEREIILSSSSEVPHAWEFKVRLAFSSYSYAPLGKIDSLTDEGPKVRALIHEFYSMVGDEQGMHYAQYLHLTDLIKHVLTTMTRTSSLCALMESENRASLERARDAEDALIEANSKVVRLQMENDQLTRALVEFKNRG